MQAYRVEGTLPMGRRTTRFTFETVAADEKGARESALSTLGSRHRVDRNHVKIENVRAVSADQVEDLAVKRALELAQK